MINYYRKYILINEKRNNLTFYFPLTFYSAKAQEDAIFDELGSMAEVKKQDGKTLKITLYQKYKVMIKEFRRKGPKDIRLKIKI